MKKLIEVCDQHVSVSFPANFAVLKFDTDLEAQQFQEWINLHGEAAFKQWLFSPTTIEFCDFCNDATEHYLNENCLKCSKCLHCSSCHEKEDEECFTHAG